MRRLSNHGDKNDELILSSNNPLSPINCDRDEVDCRNMKTQLGTIEELDQQIGLSTEDQILKDHQEIESIRLEQGSFMKKIDILKSSIKVMKNLKVYHFYNKRKLTDKL